MGTSATTSTPSNLDAVARIDSSRSLSGGCKDIDLNFPPRRHHLCAGRNRAEGMGRKKDFLHVRGKRYLAEGFLQVVNKMRATKSGDPFEFVLPRRFKEDAGR